MKQSVKIWLAAAAAFILAGLLLFAAVMTVHDWDFTSLGGAGFQTDTFDLTEGFDNISIRSGTSDIRFLPSGDGTRRVVFFERAKTECSASVLNGTLRIETADARKWYEQIPFQFGTPRITVFLPGNEYDSLSIEGSTGDIEVPEDFRFQSAQIAASTGDIAWSASSGGSVRIKASTGDIRLENLSAGTLGLSVSTGKVELRSVVCAGDADVTVSTGKVSLSDVSCRNLFSSGNTGDISMSSVIASEKISIQRSTGDVRLEGCDASELLIQTGTGDVTGSLLSEKMFAVRSDTGRIEVPESAAGGRCSITTDTGDIKIAVP